MQRIERKEDNLGKYDLTKGYLVISICITCILLAIALYLHFNDYINMQYYWGIFPLIIALPGMFVSGFNLIFFLMNGIGFTMLAFANIKDGTLALLVSGVALGLLGLITYFMNKRK